MRAVAAPHAQRSPVHKRDSDPQRIEAPEGSYGEQFFDGLREVESAVVATSIRRGPHYFPGRLSDVEGVGQTQRFGDCVDERPRSKIDRSPLHSA
jgi:hypothetical protein